MPQYIQSNRLYTEYAVHIRDAIQLGRPKDLHYEPSGADARRVLSLSRINTVPGQDRDEYPFASTREGGTGADVRLIDFSHNRRGGNDLKQFYSTKLNNIPNKLFHVRIIP